MATELNSISQAIGALQAGQSAAEKARNDHADRTERQFSSVASRLEKINTRLDDIAANMDKKIDSAMTKYMHGTLGGIIAVAGQWVAAHMGFKMP